VLLEYGAKNYFCFKDGTSVSFELDANCPESISGGRNFTPVLCVKGANGSGKTNLLKIPAFLGMFCARSFYFETDQPIPLSSHFESADPTEFYAEFISGGVKYAYELVATDTEILRETIYRTRAKRTKVVERMGNEITTVTNALRKLTSIKLRWNVSIISMAHQYELSELADCYQFFSNIASNVGYSGLNHVTPDVSTVSKALIGDQETLGFIKSFIQSCDAGISDIVIHSMKKGDKTDYFPAFIHDTTSGPGLITDITESSGTKVLFTTLGTYRKVLNTGGLLVLDEFDMNLHPHILPKLVNLFLDPEINVKDAQLIFTTHNSEIMNTLGRYRTYLVNKERNESYAYRLDEIPGDLLRNDRPITPAYNEGKIGGVPRL